MHDVTFRASVWPHRRSSVAFASSADRPILAKEAATLRRLGAHRVQQDRLVGQLDLMVALLSDRFGQILATFGRAWPIWVNFWPPALV